METVYAIHNFYAENDDELTFKVGDPILVLQKDEMYWDGWWQGQNILGQIGLFPMNYTSYDKPIQKSSYDNVNKTNSTELMKNINNISTMPEVKMQGPSADETINDIQSKLHQLAAKKHQKNLDQKFEASIVVKGNSDQKFEASVVKGNSVPNSPIRQTSQFTQIQRSLQQQPKQNGRSSISSSSGSNYSEYLSSASRQHIGNIRENNPLIWNVEQVCQWLKEKGFDSVIKHFVENDITGDILLGLDFDSLKELNIMSYGKRVHIMNAINALKESSSTLNKEDHNNSDSLQLHPIVELPVIPNTSSSSPSTISDKVDIKTETSLVNNINASWPKMNNNNNNENFQTITGKSQRKKSSRIFSKLNFTNKGDKYNNNNNNNNKSDKNETNQNIFSFNAKSVKKGKSKSPSGGWDFSENEVREIKHKSKSIKYLSKKTSKEQLDRNSLVGSQLGLPKYSIKNEVQTNRLHPVNENENVNEDNDILRNIGTPDYEGWLMKQDDQYKSWKNRFCILKEQTLYYLQSDKIAQTPRVKGSINITGYRVIPDENILQGKYGFKLVHDTERTHYFAHDNLEKMREWMKAIMKTTISRDLNSPVFSSSELSTMTLVEARKLVHTTNNNSQLSKRSDSPTLERSKSPTHYNTMNRMNSQQASLRCRSVSPLPGMSGQPIVMAPPRSKSSFKKLVKSTSFDSITVNYL